MTTFAQKLQQSRTHVGLTQAQLAERSGLGLGTIRDYEQGNREPSLRSAVMLATALGVSVEMLADSGVSGTKPADAPKKGPGRPREPTATTDAANVAEQAGDSPQAKGGAAKGKRRKK